MFTILLKDVDGRKTYRYFEEWKNAELAMMHDIKCVKELTEIIKESHLDRMNTEKGFYEREETLVGRCGMRFHYALINGYFEDDLIEYYK